MDSGQLKKTTNLFQVFLRLRPSPSSEKQSPGRFLTVEKPEADAPPTHITLNPPNDKRRAIEKFAFTQVFEEDATQLDVFHCTGVAALVEGVIAPHGGYGTDALVATLGVTGSGKSHTILGSRSQRGITQLALDVIFRSLGNNLVDPGTSTSLESSLQVSDASEASVMSAGAFLDAIFADSLAQSRGAGSRAATPLLVGSPYSPFKSHYRTESQQTPTHYPKSIRIVVPSPRFPRRETSTAYSTASLIEATPRPKRADAKHYMTLTTSTRARKVTKREFNNPKGESTGPSQHQPTSALQRRLLQAPANLPKVPDVNGVNVSSDPNAEYAIVISMYEVYNDRIFDLLTPPARMNATKDYRRRPLMFKPTESSPDRKIVAGLKKVVCGSLHEALMVLEAGLHERRVAGTGSNSVSSRSHGFICIDVKKRLRGRKSQTWAGNTLTVVDLAGSERARDAKTQGATLAEAGKINESLMYLGQCLQMQSDSGQSNKPNSPNIVPFRQCKLTELLFSNSFPSTSAHVSHTPRRNPQKAVMIVTADPLGDFNATSQILRYSALAREVTVPRIPSIFASGPPASTPTNAPHQSHGSSSSGTNNYSSPMTSPTLVHARPFFGGPGSGTQRNFSPANSHDGDRATMELAALEIARLTEELETLRRGLVHETEENEYLRGELDRESQARVVAEAHLETLEDRIEDRLLELEQIVREDCAVEFERRFAVEEARWRAIRDAERERHEEHMDRKVELLERGLVGTEAEAGDDDKENVLREGLVDENERLRREIAILRRELQGRSPTKRVPLQEREDVLQTGEAVEQLGSRMEQLQVSNEGAESVGVIFGQRKVRKLATKKWEDDLFDDME